MRMIIPTEVRHAEATCAGILPSCPVCAAARSAWQRGGAHLCCRTCELRAVAGSVPAVRHAFYRTLVAQAEVA